MRLRATSVPDPVPNPYPAETRCVWVDRYNPLATIARLAATKPGPFTVAELAAEAELTVAETELYLGDLIVKFNCVRVLEGYVSVRSEK